MKARRRHPRNSRRARPSGGQSVAGILAGVAAQLARPLRGPHSDAFAQIWGLMRALLAAVLSGGDMSALEAEIVRIETLTMEAMIAAALARPECAGLKRADFDIRLRHRRDGGVHYVIHRVGRAAGDPAAAVSAGAAARARRLRRVRAITAANLGYLRRTSRRPRRAPGLPPASDERRRASSA